MPSLFDRRLIAAARAGLPLVPRPYDAIGATLGVSGEVVRERLAGMLRAGSVRRIGALPDQRRLGFLANGLAVWDVDDARVDELGEKVGALAFVSQLLLPAARCPSGRTTCMRWCMRAVAARPNVRCCKSTVCSPTPVVATTCSTAAAS